MHKSRRGHPKRDRAWISPGAHTSTQPPKNICPEQIQMVWLKEHSSTKVYDIIVASSWSTHTLGE